MIVIASGADHDRVAKANPAWTVFDWCRYWELDARKGWRKASYPDPMDRIMDCGDQCKCRLIK